jgi:hypothetical protein
MTSSWQRAFLYTQEPTSFAKSCVVDPKLFFGSGIGFSTDFGSGSGLFMEKNYQSTVYLICPQGQQLCKKANFLHLYFFNALYLLEGKRCLTWLRIR